MLSRISSSASVAASTPLTIGSLCLARCSSRTRSSAASESSRRCSAAAAFASSIRRALAWSAAFSREAASRASLPEYQIAATAPTACTAAAPAEIHAVASAIFRQELGVRAYGSLPGATALALDGRSTRRAPQADPAVGGPGSARPARSPGVRVFLVASFQLRSSFLATIKGEPAQGSYTSRRL